MELTCNFKVGDIVKVFQKVKEGKKERIVSFKGLVVKMKGKGLNRMFTVRQTLDGVGVDRIYPCVKPVLEKVDLVETPKKRLKRANILHIKPKK